MHAGQDVTSVTGLARYLGDWTTCYVWDMYMHRYRLESSSNDNTERRGLVNRHRFNFLASKYQLPGFVPQATIFHRLVRAAEFWQLVESSNETLL